MPLSNWFAAVQPVRTEIPLSVVGRIFFDVAALSTTT